MRRIISLMAIVMLLTMPINAQRVCELEFTIHRDDTVELDKIQARPGIASEIPGGIIQSDYVLYVMDENQNIIKETHLPVSFIRLSNPPQETNKSLVWLELEYDSSWKFLEVHHDDFPIFRKNLSSLCNEDSRCDLEENWISCPQDCHSGSKDGWCDKVKDGICDPDCAEGVDPDCRLGTTTTAEIPACGNSICEESENHLLCPQDCPSGSRDGLCDRVNDGICDPDCAEGMDPDCELGTTTTAKSVDTLAHVQPSAGVHREFPSTTEENPPEDLSSYLPYLLAIILITTLLLIYRRQQRTRLEAKKSKEEEELRYWVEGQLRAGEDPSALKKALRRDGSDPAMVDEIMQKL